MSDDGLRAGGTWLELSVEADQEAVEAVSEILSRVAPGGVSVEVPFRPAAEGLAAEVDPAQPATVRAYLPALDGAAARRSVDATRERLGHLQAFGLRRISELSVRPVHEEDWAAAWKQHFPVLRVGRRLVIRPTWRRHRASPDDVVLALDPGMAFGTGLHPTTRLCLAGVERWADVGLVDGARVLDVGCGSGILGIAAVRLGAASASGVDVDPIAVEATTTNARRNRVARRVRARPGSLPVPGRPFDLVLANLVASVLIDLAGELAAAVRPPGSRGASAPSSGAGFGSAPTPGSSGAPGSGGRLLASGIFIDREVEVRDAFDRVGLQLVDRSTEGDWVALDLERVA
jgi:ribosomal protein L11 methyltransferase